MRELIAMLAGAVFGIGLILSGMNDPKKIQSFLDVLGAWDPSMALVMVGAVSIGTMAFAVAEHRPTSLIGDPMDIPQSREIDRRLIAGGMLFGVGWGIAGMCPGPAIVNLGAGHASAIVFVLAMLMGMFIHDRLVASTVERHQ